MVRDKVISCTRMAFPIGKSLLCLLLSVLCSMRTARKSPNVKEVFKPTDKKLPQSVLNKDIIHTGDVIPKYVWIASCQGISTSLSANINELKSFNPEWEVIVQDCDQQREMIKAYDDSILHVYDLINPTLYAARADIWRYVVLYMYGGMYIDVDVKIRMNLNEILEGFNDSLVLAMEDVSYRGIYNDNYKLADADLLTVNVSNRVCSKSNDTYDAYSDKCTGWRWYKGMDYPVRGIGRKTVDLILTQWMIFSKPRHIVMSELLINIADMVRQEYFCTSVINASLLDPAFPMQRLFSITGPWALTATIRDIVHRNASLRQEIRIVDGLNFYLWYPQIKHDVKRSYFRAMKKHRQQFLRSYKCSRRSKNRVMV